MPPHPGNQCPLRVSLGLLATQGLGVAGDTPYRTQLRSMGTALTDPSDIWWTAEFMISSTHRGMILSIDSILDRTSFLAFLFDYVKGTGLKSFLASDQLLRKLFIP